jgi:hypothetical protein
LAPPQAILSGARAPRLIPESRSPVTGPPRPFSRKESAIGLKQQLTQELNVVLNEGREVARRLRVAAKAQLGTKNERLVQFKAAPLRNRKGRRAKSSKAPAGQTDTTPQE